MRVAQVARVDAPGQAVKKPEPEQRTARARDHEAGQSGPPEGLSSVFASFH